MIPASLRAMTTPNVLTPERKQKLEAREVWLADAVERLRRDFNRGPKMLWLMLLTVPALALGKFLIAFTIAAFITALVGVTVYIAWGHLHEHEVELSAIRSELRIAAKAAAAAAAAGAKTET
jgi:hypothetical protein